MESKSNISNNSNLTPLGVGVLLPYLFPSDMPCLRPTLKFVLKFMVMSFSASLDIPEPEKPHFCGWQALRNPIKEDFI